MKKILCFWLLAFSLLLPTAAQPQYLVQTALPTSPDSRYELGQEAALRIVAHAGGVPLDGVEVTCGSQWHHQERFPMEKRR